VVSDVAVTLGDMAMPGRPLVTMHDPSALRITAAVPQASMGALSSQLQAVRYELPDLQGHTGLRAPTQTQLLPTVDAATHTAQIRLSLPTGVAGLTPGLFAHVWLPGSATPQAPGAERLYLPVSAIVQRAEMTGVYVVDKQNQARLRQVRLGRTQGARVEILSGLRKDDSVAADPQAAAAAR